MNFKAGQRICSIFGLWLAALASGCALAHDLGGGTTENTSCAGNPKHCDLTTHTIGPAPGCDCVAMTARCRGNNDCAGGNVCISPSGHGDPNKVFELCNGTCTDGICGQTCNPFVPVSGCPGTNPCTFLGATSNVPNQALCFTGGPGGENRAACTATYDANHQYVSDNCNRSKNYLCNGTTEQRPIGTCARLCKRGMDQICQALTGRGCTVTTGDFGLCL